MYKFLGKPGKMYSLDSETTTIKLNYNCPADQKSGEGKGSCGGVAGKGGDTKSSTGNLSYDKFLSSIESSETPIVMSYDQFKAKSGLTFLGDDHGMFRMPHGISKAEQKYCPKA